MKPTISGRPCPVLRLLNTNGRSPRIASFEDLDRVSGGDTLDLLAKVQPFVHGFIEENVEHPEARKLLALIALAFDR